MFFNLKTRKFIDGLDDLNQNINQKKIIIAMRECYKNTAFSTFPYITRNFNSKKSMEKYNSGNCIALSLYLQKYLFEKYKLKSFLVPATVPKMFSSSEYLELSHVALAIPKNKNKVYIADLAFYFLNPIKVIINSEKERHIYSKDIYCKEIETNPKKYISLEKVLNRTKKTNKEIVFNDYQKMEENTYYSECCFKSNKSDIWKYYLIEIVNPDESISNFFTNIKNNPFIVSTKIDDNGICTSNFFIKFKDNEIHINKNLETIKIIPYKNILTDLDNFKNLIQKEFHLESFFDDELIYSIYNFIKNESDVKKNIMIKD